MADEPTASKGTTNVSREQLIELLNEDLAREYQAIIAYVVYSQVLKGAQYMNIAGELEMHASEELQHALTSPSRSITSAAADGDAQAGQDVGQGGGHAPLRPGQRERDDAELSRAGPPVRGARRIRPGRADPRDPGQRAGAPDRPGDRAGDRRARRHQARGTA